MRSTRRMPMTSPTVDPSTVCHSIEGWGLPVAEQSRKPPDELLNSSLGGGSITKLGPRKWASNGRALGDSRLTSRLLCGRGEHRRIFRDNTWGEQWVYGKSSQRYTRCSYRQDGRTCDGMGHGLISKGSDVDVVVDGGRGQRYNSLLMPSAL